MFKHMLAKRNLGAITKKSKSILALMAMLVSVCSPYSICATQAATSASLDHLLISEVFYDTPSGASEEWIEIYNPTATDVDVSSYKVGDEETKDGGEGMYQFPADTKIQAGAKIVVASKADGFFNLYSKEPNFELSDTDSDVPNMAKYNAWASGSLNLTNSGDEVVLLDGNDNPVDVVTYESGSYPGVVPHPGVTTGHSLERSPADEDTDDCSIDFIDQATPNPETEIPTQPPLPEPETKSDFSISMSPNTMCLEQGKSGSTEISVVSIGEFNSEVALSVWGVPFGTTVSFDPGDKVIPTGNTSLEIQTSASTPTGSHVILVLAVGGEECHYCYLNLEVTCPPVDPAAKPDFAIAANPQKQVITRGDTASFTINLTSIDGFSSPVNVGVYGLPLESIYSFSSNPLVPDGSTTLTIDTTSTIRYGTHHVLVVGVGGGKVHYCYVRLMVLPGRCHRKGAKT